MSCLTNKTNCRPLLPSRNVWLHGNTYLSRGNISICLPCRFNSGAVFSFYIEMYGRLVNLTRFTIEPMSLIQIKARHLLSAAWGRDTAAVRDIRIYGKLTSSCSFVNFSLFLSASWSFSWNKERLCLKLVLSLTEIVYLIVPDRLTFAFQ